MMPVRKRGRRTPGTTQTKGRSCTRKDRFPTQELAEDKKWSRVRRMGADPNAVNVYPCKFKDTDGSTHWHVGHTPGNQMKH